MCRLFAFVFFVFSVFSVVSVSGQGSLVRHRLFVSQLGAEDLAALYSAQDAERRAADLLLGFYESYDAAAGIVMAYGKAGGMAAADSLQARFTETRKLASERARELETVWEKIFDNKTFAYNYILEACGEREELRRMESAGRDTGDEIARRRDGEESEQVLEYLEQKALLLNYERTLARLLGALSAVDSLAGASRVFEMLKRPLPALELVERSFIDYQPIKIYSPSRYNSANPVPQVTEYRNGIVYRVRLGRWSARQVVSVFKGVFPLGFRREGALWDYYAGGYEDFAASEKALADMKKRGFAKAVLVVWNDGVATVLGAGQFRVEIGGGGLSEGVRAAIKGDVDITRLGEKYVVGTFDSGVDAERVAAALRAADPELDVRVVQI